MRASIYNDKRNNFLKLESHVRPDHKAIHKKTRLFVEMRYIDSFIVRQLLSLGANRCVL